MLEVTNGIRIPLDEFEWSFARSGGPGGQNVNKVASKAVLRWDFEHSPSVPDAVKARFRERFPSRLTTFHRPSSMNGKFDLYVWSLSKVNWT